MRFDVLTAPALALLGCATRWTWDGKPTNELQRNYKTIEPWGRLPASHPKWGALNGIAVDNDGRALWVVDRCGANPDVPAGANPFTYDSCAGSSWAPVHKVDADGNVIKSFGAAPFLFPLKAY